MPRIRSVYPAICEDQDLANVSAEAERTFVRLWTHFDDDGRCEDRPKLIAARLYPEHDSMDAAKVDRDLNELAKHDLLIRYEVDGKRYVSAKPQTWAKYQKPKHPKASELPSPETGNHVPETGEAVPESLHVDVVVEGEVDVEGEVEGVSPLPSKRRTQDSLFESVATACDIDWRELTPQARGPLNVAVKQLRDLDVDPPEVHERAANWPNLFPGATLTPTALAKHWPQLARARSPARRDRFAEMGRSLQERVDQTREVSDGQVGATTYETRRGLPAG